MTGFCIPLLPDGLSHGKAATLRRRLRRCFFDRTCSSWLGKSWRALASPAAHKEIRVSVSRDIYFNKIPVRSFGRLCCTPSSGTVWGSGAPITISGRASARDRNLLLPHRRNTLKRCGAARYNSATPEAAEE